MTTLASHLAEKPFTLVMSSGFFGFFAHTGMLLALESRGLAPSAFAGSSAGALVGSLAASGLSAETIAEGLLGLERADFWDPAFGPGFLRGASFRSRLEALLPVTTFEACPRPLVVSTHDLRRNRTHVIAEGPLVPAVYASCAVPLLFHAIRHDGRLLADGGIADRPGLAGVPANTRVLHHHLSSRSPWRTKNSPALEPPRRAGLVALVLDGIPRSGPFRLDEGRRALHVAREATLRALDRRVVDSMVRVTT